MIRRFPLFGLLLVAPLCAALNHVIHIDTGLVEGTPGRTPGITVFKGIPYAAPPVGELRWRAPQPPAKWRGVRHADHFSAGCPQRRSGPFGPWSAEFISKAGMEGGASEDCLYLNVWTGAKAAREKRPVFVWIHGGGFTSGSGDVPVYDGDGLAAKGLVMVTINYRLGVLGFLAHPELTKESADHASGNYAMLDAIAALRWVRRNIAAFGGDPRNVTIAGQSAGAFMVNYLVTSPLAKGLFERAIAESGGAFMKTATLEEAQEQGLEYAQSVHAATLAELRAKPAGALTAAVHGMEFGPIVDGYVVPAQVRTIFAQGRQNDVPVLTGWNVDDGVMFGPPLKAQAFREQAHKRYGDLADAFLRAFPADDDAAAAASERAAGRDQMFGWEGRTWGNWQSKTGKSKIFLYYFNRVAPGTPQQTRFGAFHSGEIAYALNTLAEWDRPWEQADRKLAQVMSGYWVNFARHGDPNGAGLPVWAAYTARDERSMLLGEKVEAIATPDKARLDFFDLYNSRGPAFFVFEDGLGNNPPEKEAEIAKQIGFAGISFDGAKLVPERIKATESHGLKFFFLYLAADVSGPEPVYEPGFDEVIRQLKGRNTVIWLIIRGQGPGAEARAVEAAQHTADLAAKEGLRVALYPHYGLYVARLEDALRIAGQAKRPNLGVTFNLCHELRSGGGPDFRPLLERAMPMLYAVSINGADKNGQDWDRLIQPLDRGDFDVKGLLETLVELGYHGPIGLQCYEIKGDVIENLQHSMQAWRTMQSEIQ